MRLSIMFYPNKAKTISKTGRIPVYVRITLNRQKVESRLNIEVIPSDVSKWDGRTMRFTDRNMSANTLLNTIDKKFEDFRHHNATQLSSFDIKSIRNIILGVNAKPEVKICQFLDQYYKTAIETNAGMAEGTKRNYRKAIRHLKEFLIFRNSANGHLKDVTMKFANDFKDYLLGNDLNNERLGMKECSALDNVKRLRTIFDRAVEEEQIPNNSFKKLKLKSKPAPRARLDIHQVKQIYDLDLKEFPTQHLYKDMFLFSIFTGLAYADSSTLKQSDLNLMKDGNIRLILQRAKTNVITEMILPKQAIEIMNKYKKTTEIEITRGVLPKRSNKEVNVQLKILANMVNITVKLSTHIARHTFRQLLAEAGHL